MQKRLSASFILCLFGMLTPESFATALRGLFTVIGSSGGISGCSGCSDGFSSCEVSTTRMIVHERAGGGTAALRSSPRHRRRLCVLILCALSVVTRIGAVDQVIILSPHNEAIREEFGLGFQRWHERVLGASVRVEWRDVGGSSEALRFVQSEFAKKPLGVGVDCFFGGGLEPFLLLAQKRFLEPYRHTSGTPSHKAQCREGRRGSD